MSAPSALLRGYNILMHIHRDDDNFDRRLFRFALRHRTHTVTGASDPDHNGVWVGAVSLPAFRLDLGEYGSNRVTAPAVTLTIARGEQDNGLSDQVVDRIRDWDYLVGAHVDFYRVREGNTRPSSSNLFHRGRIQRGDLEIGRDEVRVTCRDRMAFDDVPLPSTRFGRDWPIEPDARNRVVPLLFGPWHVEQSDYWVRAWCMDMANTTPDTTLKARFAQPGSVGLAGYGFNAIWLDSDGRYKRDETGYRTHPIKILDTTTGLFELEGTDYSTIERLWEDGDQIFVQAPKGERGADGTLITSPVEMIRHLLTDGVVGMGLSDGDLDEESFQLAAQIVSTNGYVCRAYVDEETTALELIGQIAGDFGFKLMVRRGRYALASVGFDEKVHEATATIVPEQVLSWTEINDQDRAGSGRFVLDYRRHPERGESTRRLSVGESDEDETTEHRVDSHWIFSDDTAELVAANWYLAFGGVLRTLRLELDFDGLELELGEFVNVIWPEGEGVFQVTSLNVNFDLPIRCEVVMQSLNRPWRTGVWAAEPGESVPQAYGGGTMPEGWHDATRDQLERLSFWVSESEVNYDGSAPKVWGR
ncbi:MAG: hypothetical protein H6685_02070 [Deltaproteobacteria bacterium]|nr:hypothetical protein [Deltaproteobacteria bacterium]